MACAKARMPKPEVFSERKSSSMMIMGKRNFMAGRQLALEVKKRETIKITRNS
jgi:hypothetical protein